MQGVVASKKRGDKGGKLVYDADDDNVFTGSVKEDVSPTAKRNYDTSQAFLVETSAVNVSSRKVEMRQFYEKHQELVPKSVTEKTSVNQQESSQDDRLSKLRQEVESELQKSYEERSTTIYAKNRKPEVNVPKEVKKKAKFVTKGGFKKGQLNGYSTAYVPSEKKGSMIAEEEVERNMTVTPVAAGHNIPASQEFMVGAGAR